MCSLIKHPFRSSYVPFSDFAAKQCLSKKPTSCSCSQTINNLDLYAYPLIKTIYTMFYLWNIWITSNLAFNSCFIFLEQSYQNCTYDRARHLLYNFYFIVSSLREAAKRKRKSFLMAVPLKRGGGWWWVKGLPLR